MKVVTSGLTFLDIDAYAGCVAYTELLNLQGVQAIAFSSASINESVTETIRSWNAPLSQDYIPVPNDTFVLIDVSEPEFIDKVVDITKVEEVIDHHVGYEKFWQDRLGPKSNIKFIGAACTLIYESWCNAGLLNQMSKTSARLLVSGILDNTLNFKAAVTTDRDHQAYDQLLKIAHLPKDWAAQYFQECEKSIFSDIAAALTNDTKLLKLRQLESNSVAFGQMVIWDANKIIKECRNEVETTMSKKSGDWFVNVVSIANGQSFFIASNNQVVHWAEQVLGVTFDNRLAVAGRLWLRKEIIKLDINEDVFEQNHK